MNGKFILLSGSAGWSCPADKLDLALSFVSRFTQEILTRGGGIVVLAGDEASAKDERGKPHIFDWIALREVERYADTTTETPRPCARIIMSDEAREKIDDANLRLLTNLEQRNAVELYSIRREVYTGGEYRDAMIEKSDAMLAIGGGKGTYTAATVMMDLRKPVLPIHIQLGSIVNDGDGAVDLHQEIATNPEWFFPATHNQVANKTGLLSLDRGINDADAVALAAAEMLTQELESLTTPERPSGVNGRLATAWQYAREIPIIASVIKIIEWLIRIFT